MILGDFEVKHLMIQKNMRYNINEDECSILKNIICLHKKPSFADKFQEKRWSLPGTSAGIARCGMRWADTRACWDGALRDLVGFNKNKTRDLMGFNGI